MFRGSRPGLAVLLVAATACGRPPSADVAADSTAGSPRTRPASAPAASEPGSVLRVPAGGGPVQAYAAAGLTPLAWRSVDRVPPGSAPVGADLEQRVVYLLERRAGVLALDLDLLRVRPVAPAAREASMGPDGSLYTVDAQGQAVRYLRRRPIRYREKLVGGLTALFGTADGLAHVIDSSGALTSYTPAQGMGVIPLPRGPAAIAMWGDQLAVAADSGYVLARPGRAVEPSFKRVRGGVRAVAFSPSAHRLYVVRERGPLMVLDRYSGDVLEQVDVGGGARDLRQDRAGRWLLLRAAGGDTVQVLDGATLQPVAQVAAPWGRDLPAVAGTATLLVRRGADVVAYDLERGAAEAGVVAGGAADGWLPLPWAPRRRAVADAATDAAGPSAALAPEPPTGADGSAEPAADAADDGAEVLLQVSASRNPEWAEELARKIRGQGLPARVLAPPGPDDPYRVVLGPYPTRDAAEEAARKLGMPSFILTVRPDAGR